MAEKEGIAVVIDNGSCSCRAGFAGEDTPRVIFPSIVGRSRQQDCIEGSLRYSHVAAEAMNSRGTLQLRYPVEFGIITDWDGVERIWQHAFTQGMHINPEEHPVLLSERAINPKADREKMTQIMFETFNVPALCVANHASLAMVASDRTTGIVVEIGSSVIHTMPVYEGLVLPWAVHHLDMGGRDLTVFLLRMLQERGFPLDTASDREEVKAIKEKFCCVAQNYDEENESFSSSDPSAFSLAEYTLPDGKVITLGVERIRCPEALFQPSLVNMEMPGMHDIAHSSIKKCEPSILHDVYGNVVLSGGTALLPGMAERLERELTALAPDSVKVRVVAPPSSTGHHFVWSGGSKLASLPSFRSMCISLDDYNEYGPSLVHRKCY